jgi:hypothetical protein
MAFFTRIKWIVYRSQLILTIEKTMDTNTVHIRTNNISIIVYCRCYCIKMWPGCLGRNTTWDEAALTTKKPEIAKARKLTEFGVGLV